MNDQKLNGILRKLKVPSANTAERAKHRALMAFKLKPQMNTDEHRCSDTTLNIARAIRCSGAAVLRLMPSEARVNFPHTLRFCAGVSVVAIVVAVMVAIFSQPRQTDASGKLLVQVSQLFPNRLNAVIERNGIAEIDLAETANPALIADQPLVVSFVRDGEKIKVLSFSGRIVRLEIDGKEVTFETLVTADGQVIVNGDNFFWSHDNPNQLLGYRIQAQPLIASL